MSSRMTELSVQDLAPEALTLLRRHNLLAALVQAEVVAEAVGAVVLSEEQCDQLWNGYLNKHQIANDEQLASHLTARGLDADALHWQLELPVRVQQHSREQFQHKAEARFLAKKEQLDRVVYSLLRVRDGFLARELYLRIAGQEANSLPTWRPSTARALNPKRKNRGPWPSTKLIQLLSERLRTSQPGQLLEPFRIEDWWCDPAGTP